MTKMILLVEDNPSDEKLTLRALKGCGVANEVFVVRDGAEAIDFLFGSGPFRGQEVNRVPTLILLDLRLPRIEGLEVLRRIRAHPPTAVLPVVILTSSKEDEDIARGYALGANAYVRKPLDFAEFAQAAKVLGLFWLLLNQPAPVPAARLP
jgi:two-component system response regulator